MRKSVCWIAALSCLALGLGVVPGMQTSEAQTLPPDMPSNRLSPLIPFAQGIANIEAQGAARPKAVQPVLPGAGTGPSNAPASPLAGQPTAPAPR